MLVSDDYPLFARGVAAVLRAHDDWWIQTSADPPRRLTDASGADVLVLGMDADMRGIWEACDHLLALFGDLASLRPVVLLPGRSEFEMTAAASLSAAAVLPRSAAPEVVLEAVQAAAEGRSLVASGMAERMLADFAGMLRRRREASGVDLSKREQEVLELIALGYSNHSIAGALHVSDNTVKNHVARILEKLGAGSRTEALVVAVRAGLVEIGQAGVGGQGPAGSTSSPRAPRA